MSVEPRGGRMGIVRPSAAVCDQAALFLPSPSLSYRHTRTNTDLLLPVQDTDDNKDEDADSDQGNGRQQHTVTGCKVQLGAPADERERE